MHTQMTTFEESMRMINPQCNNMVQTHPVLEEI